MDQKKLVCQNCDVKISNPTAGKIVQGNIHVAQVNEAGEPCGGVIGENLPEQGFLFSRDDVKCNTYCNSCFLKLVGLDPFAEYFS